MSTSIILLKDSILPWVNQVRTVGSDPVTFVLVTTHLLRDSTVSQRRLVLHTLEFRGNGPTWYKAQMNTSIILLCIVIEWICHHLLPVG